nr:MAG TPA: hypothetical protein [Caudoviricetes sp.]DAI64651.1 MAG TPA: hypothetical protein [Caudoviricetes sp.]DAI85389.1 MAG TPA: hypothetical protein [Caudoviricetes sp.]
MQQGRGNFCPKQKGRNHVSPKKICNYKRV